MVSFKDVIKTMEARWFMIPMATGAVGVFWELMKLPYSKIIAESLVWLALAIFLIVSFVYLVRIIAFPKEVVKDLKHPIANNFFAGFYIAVGVLITGLVNVIGSNMAINIAKVLYFIGLPILLLLIILIPSINYISEKVDTKHSLGIWYLPPVGLFVLILLAISLL